MVRVVRRGTRIKVRLWLQSPCLQHYKVQGSDHHHSEEFWKNVVHWSKKWQPIPVFLSGEPKGQYEKAKSKLWEIMEDRGSCHATIHGISNSRSRLSDWTIKTTRRPSGTRPRTMTHSRCWTKGHWRKDMKLHLLKYLCWVLCCLYSLTSVEFDRITWLYRVEGVSFFFFLMFKHLGRKKKETVNFC